MIKFVEIIEKEASQMSYKNEDRALGALESALEAIIEEFSQAEAEAVPLRDGKTSSFESGKSLGLRIAKEIIEGRIETYDVKF